MSSTAFAAGDPATTLIARYEAVSERITHSPLGEPVYLTSAQGAGVLTGDIDAVVAHPFAGLSETLLRPAAWCDALLLHLNVKYCRAGGTPAGLSVALGRKVDQSLEDTYRVAFRFDASASTAHYFKVDLAAPAGPLGSRDYRIDLEAVALDAEHSFLHLHYSYRLGLEARLASETYLATTGAHKIGFTVVGEDHGRPVYIGGLRGAVERNVMRYYLALEAYLAAPELPAGGRFASCLERAFEATERHAPQLHEIDREAYLAMKRREYARQQRP